jgi:DeoR family suf operon transcriptional repressor
MAINRWLQRLLGGSRGRIVAELRRGPATINELIERLTLSANAVRSHLAALERDGIVAPDEPVRGGVGKPACTYRLTASASALTPKAYDAMLATVLDATRERVGKGEYAAILRGVAERLAGGSRPSGTLDERLRDTRKLLAQIGANVEVQRSGNKLRLRGMDCPLAALVAVHPELCSVLAGVISRRVGVAVAECCDRSAELPRCCFEMVIERAA